MKIKLFLVVLFFIFFNSKTIAQDFKLGNVSVNELKEKVHPKDSTAVAAIIFQKTTTTFIYNINTDFTAIHECQIRIKIYKKEGLNWANFKVPYYVGNENGKDDTVKFSNGITYNFENGEIVKTKLTSEGSFKKNLNEYWNEATITLPNVKVGSIIEFKYILKSENLVKFPVFNVQYDIPVNYSEYSTKIPEFFIYKPILTGYVAVKSESKFAYGSQIFENEYHQSNSLSYKQINTTYITENVPALTNEDYVDNIRNYKTSIQYELERIRYPDKPDKDYSKTWEGVAKTIFDDKEFGKELDEQLFFLEDLKKILKKDQNIDFTDSEKLDIIFKFVQQKMNWNNDFGYYTDKGVKKAYLDQTGNIAEINFILINMLKLAGINADPVLVSTVEHGIPVFPNRTVFNYVIAAAEIDGKKILLDATNKFTIPNILPLNTLNWVGRLIKKDGTSEEINLVPTIPSKNNYFLMLTVGGSGKISGKLRVQKTDYEALSFRENYGKMNKEAYVEKLENELNGIEISEYNKENSETDFSKPISENFTFSTEKQSEIIADKMFINPMLFFTLSKNPFVLEKRQMPIYFGYPKQEKYNIYFEIPEGYVLESMPKPIKIVTAGKEALFSMNLSTQENKIQIAITKEINSAIFSVDFYDELKNYYLQMIDKLNEKIVLKKI